MTATVSVVGTGLGSGQVNETFSYANTNANETVTAQTLNVGVNTITVPTQLANPLGVVIIPPATNLNTITLKGVAGDTGILISGTNPSLLTFQTGTPPATFVLTVAGGSIPGTLFRWI